MSRLKLRRWWPASFFGLIAVGTMPTIGQVPPKPSPARWDAPTSLLDPRLEPIRRASADWARRAGPDRAVVDQVCLVPDLPAFFEAIAAWDRGHYFPILIEDVESNLRFIRAFRPARVVRLPRSAAPIAGGRAWDRAVDAVGASWRDGPGPVETSRRGDAVPRDLGPTPPGVVVSSPDAPMLAGAVALAAGRFQPLLRLDPTGRFDDLLSGFEIGAFDRSLTGAIRGRVPSIEQLGDDCDFVTLAGDYPYRYRDAKGESNAVDDRIGRLAGSDHRWAFAGRLLGDPRASVYRAMCSLFLQPESALLFNGYDEVSSPWSAYSMRDAAIRLEDLLTTSHVSGDKLAGIDGWHETFDPTGRFGLVMINSHGSPTVFNLRGGPAAAADIPRGVPSAVLMIHSYSAASPNDPETVAGRWLANGSFIFYGSVNEPFLASFRNPRLVADLIAEHLPIVAAVRTTLAEPFGRPWRLVYLGDPLYRIKGRSANPARLDRWGPTETWPADAGPPRPSPDAPDEAKFRHVLGASVARLGADPQDAGMDDLVEELLAIDRARLDPGSRESYDALLAEVLLQARRRGALRARIATIPEGERSAALRRCHETLLAIDLALTITGGDAARCREAWSDLIRSDASAEFKEQSTVRVGRLADTPPRRLDWSDLLRSTLRGRAKSPEAGAIAAELKRVEEASRGDRPPPAGP